MVALANGLGTAEAASSGGVLRRAAGAALGALAGGDGRDVTWVLR